MEGQGTEQCMGGSIWNGERCEKEGEVVWDDACVCEEEDVYMVSERSGRGGMGGKREADRG